MNGREQAKYAHPYNHVSSMNQSSRVAVGRATPIAALAMMLLASVALTACRRATPTPTPEAEAGAGYTCADLPPDTAKPPPHEPPTLKGEDPSQEGPEREKPVPSKPVCPDGQVPIPVQGMFVPQLPKGNPMLGPVPVDADRPFSFKAMDPAAIRAGVRKYDEVYRPRQDGDTSERPPEPPSTATGGGTCEGVQNAWGCFYYASASDRRAADGGGMILSVEQPPVAGGTDHTLNEIAVQGGDQGGNIVELGWNVSNSQYSDNAPHLFVFHWMNWVPTCYDGCGWQQWSTTYFPGMSLSSWVGREVYVGYVVWEGNWWAWFDNQWLGYFPGSEWSGAYARNDMVQWFGEVASDGASPPVTDMGNGAFPANATAARMFVLCDVDASAWVCWYRDQQGISATVPRYYDIARTGFGSVRYGGPGQ